jgi:hypothetical protein
MSSVTYYENAYRTHQIIPTGIVTLAQREFLKLYYRKFA